MSPIAPNKNVKKLNHSLKITGIGSCAIGLTALVIAVCIYFPLKRASENEAYIDIANYHAMLQAVKIVMLGIVPFLAVIFIFVGFQIFRYLHKKKAMNESSSDSKS